jgi:amidase
MDYQELQLRRMSFRGQVTECLASVDLLLVPVHPFPPLSLEALGVMGERPELIARLQAFTAPFDLTGHPALTLPGGFDGKDMPIGFQLIAADLAEGILLKAGAAFQRVSSWHRRHPQRSNHVALAHD